jgi:UDP-N-acetylmuramoylalanine--D-glutamate ligase
MNGIEFYDDSISTTVESTINAIESIHNASTVLLGGMDRGINYSPLVDYLSQSKLANIICAYASGKRIYEMLLDYAEIKPTVTYCDDLLESIRTAQRITPSGTACILSPASASYGYFTNFEERGNVYKEAIFNNYEQLNIPATAL